MNSRAYLLAVLLVSPAWAAEPAAEIPVTPAPSFDLRSDVVKTILRKTAATQFSNVLVPDKVPVKAERAEVVFVPAEKPPEPVIETPRLPDAAPRSHGFIPAVVDILIDEALGAGDKDEVTASNEILRCRVQKEQKTSPPGVDNCPIAK
jgi:hypothetical protein